MDFQLTRLEEEILNKCTEVITSIENCPVCGNKAMLVKTRNFDFICNCKHCRHSFNILKRAGLRGKKNKNCDTNNNSISLVNQIK